MAAPLVLASRSPQRRAILDQLGVEFRIVAPDVEELTDGVPAEVVVENALRKARAVAGRLARETTDVAPDTRVERGADPGQASATRVLGVDTAVVTDGRVLGKPREETEARQFLEALAGREHAVWSGLALVALSPEDDPDAPPATAASCTTVRFRPLDPREVAWYVASGEWRERAGGYAIQGRGAALVERIDGDYWTVVGLPVPELVRAAPDLFAN